jgi:hypothetical protein
MSRWQGGFTPGRTVASSRDFESLAASNFPPPVSHSPVCSHLFGFDVSRWISIGFSILHPARSTEKILPACWSGINQETSDRVIRKFPMLGPTAISITVPGLDARYLICPHLVQTVWVCPFLGPVLMGFGSLIGAPQWLHVFSSLFIRFPPNSRLICDPCPLNNNAWSNPVFQRGQFCGTAWTEMHPFRPRGSARGRRASHLRSWR